ncbi:MAG: alkaline phosphatase family protein [Candidatus Eisenbacteria bacterium]|nr:alkaline phosphatase family protein [Candidatus Eisenbacteria bacterium]
MRSRRSVALCFFVDALGWEMAQAHGCFREIAPHAYRQRTVLGYSCAAQPTILTGMMPSEHGHWGMFYRSERSDLAPLRHLRLIPTPISTHRRFRRRLLHHHRRKYGFTGYYNFYRIPFGLFDRFDIVEKRDIFAPGAFEPGVSSIFDDARQEGIPFRSWSWKTGLDRGLGELTDDLKADESDFYLFYTPHIDGFLHGKIGDPPAVARELALIEEKIESVVEVAHESCGDVSVIIYSDHGMLKTTGTVDLMSRIDQLGLRSGRDYLAFYDSTMARFWFTDSRARTRIVACLGDVDGGRILTDQELKDEGTFFEDRRFGELVFLMDPGLLILPSYMGAEAPAGMHGFTPEHPDSYAVLMSSRKLEAPPSHIRDTYRVMRSLL